MKVIVELNSFGLDIYNVEKLTKIAEETIKSAGVVDGAKEITISVAIVDDKEIKRINKELRGKDVETDVISIGEYSDVLDISEEKSQMLFLGEVVLCYTYIEKFAQENNANIDKEFFTVYSHGILHLLGFEHGKDMFKIQDDVALKFCNT